MNDQYSITFLNTFLETIFECEDISPEQGKSIFAEAGLLIKDCLDENNPAFDAIAQDIIEKTSTMIFLKVCSWVIKDMLRNGFVHYKLSQFVPTSMICKLILKNFEAHNLDSVKIFFLNQKSTFGLTTSTVSGCYLQSQRCILINLPDEICLYEIESIAKNPPILFAMFHEIGHFIQKTTGHQIFLNEHTKQSLRIEYKIIDIELDAHCFALLCFYVLGYDKFQLCESMVGHNDNFAFISNNWDFVISSSGIVLE